MHQALKSGDAIIMEGVEMLIKAADYIETREKRQRETDHGYASTFRYDDDQPMQKRMKPSKKNQSRTSHNELEKNRRAHLRNCLDNLKAIVPLGQDSSRHTTLGLLNKATLLIRELENKFNNYEAQKIQLEKQNESLRRIRNSLLDQQLSTRIRYDSTNSAGLSDLSTDSDKEEIIDVTECSSSGDELIQEMMAVNTMPAELVVMS